MSLFDDGQTATTVSTASLFSFLAGVLQRSKMIEENSVYFGSYLQSISYSLWQKRAWFLFNIGGYQIPRHHRIKRCCLWCARGLRLALSRNAEANG
jgi:hypothetical protein